MQPLQWLESQMPFLQTEWFTILYGLIVFLNPIAVAVQLISSIRSKPEELRGVAVSTFIIFLTIQLAVALGAIKSMDTILFLSMTISAVETFLVIIITTARRSNKNH